MVKGRKFNLVRCSSSSSTREMFRTIDFDSLPEDILIQILIHIPAQDLFDATMFVCRRWCHMIQTRDFRFSHLHCSTSGLLVKHKFKNKTSFMSMTRAGQFEISAFSYNPVLEFWSSCNGLLLEPDFRDHYELVIANPVTMQHLALPPFITRNQLPTYRSTIAFVAKHMKYKVVRSYCKGSPYCRSRQYCAILTVGVDNSWRLVDTKHLSVTASGLLNKCPLVTEGFVHWAQDRRSNRRLILNNEKGIITKMRNNSVLTMNMETEIITQCLAPQWNGWCYYYKYLSGGNYLSLMIGRGYLNWEVWEMKPETREWTKLPDIDLEAHKGLLNESYDVEETELKPGDGDCLDCKLVPAGWLKYREVIIFVVYRPKRDGAFRRARLHAVYNVQTQDISVFELDYNFHPYLVHTNSLTWIY